MWGCLKTVLAIIGALFLLLLWATKPPTTSSLPDLKPQLLLENWYWHRRYSYVIAEGRVCNISSTKLRNVEAVVEFYDRGGRFITSDSALIEYKPLLPGQCSPFKVISAFNPAMHQASITFSHLLGGQIQFTTQKNMIKEDQEILAQLGYDPGPADGIMGTKTRRALSAFAKDHNLEFDGVITPELLDKLRDAKESSRPEK